MRQIRAQRDVWDAHTSRDWPGLPPLSKGLNFDVSQVRSLLRIRPVCVRVCVSVLSIYCSVYVSARAAGTFNQPIRLLCVPRLAFPFDVMSRRNPKMKFHIQIFQLFSDIYYARQREIEMGREVGGEERTLSAI